MKKGMKIAILGAESTGKTWLARAMGEHLGQLLSKNRDENSGLEVPGRRVVVVAEYLREWCDLHGRTPALHEQPHIAQQQTERIVQAAQQADIVIADTTALMTAVYSEYLFGDVSLYAAALRDQTLFDDTLVTGLDLPWEADGYIRDGPHVREPVDSLLRAALGRAGISWRVVYGQGPARLQQALAGLGMDSSDPAGRPLAPDAAPRWSCDKCSDPDCERRLFARLLCRPDSLDG